MKTIIKTFLIVSVVLAIAKTGRTQGMQMGKYCGITVFAITSVDARDQYWPAGKPETAILKQAFLPLKELANELEGYLVKGSYLEPSGGAAAIFESKEWTDYIYQSP